MNDKQFFSMLRGVIYSTAMVEVILGKKVKQKIHKRLAKLTEEQQNLVWVVLFNLLNPFSPAHPGKVDVELIPVIMDEAERIYKMIEEKAPLNIDEIYRKMEPIIERKYKFAEKEIQNRKPNGIWN